MSSVTSEMSSSSMSSRTRFDNFSNKSEAKISKPEANINDSMISKVWKALGSYLAKNLRSGRAINIQHFGIFTFSAPDVNLEGVTNPENRDLRHRFPVFLISKEFIKGMNIQTGIINAGVIRPYSITGVISGIPVAKINYTEISYMANINKDASKTCIDKVIKELAEKVKSKKYCELDIPGLGKLMIRNQIAAIEFDDLLIVESLDSTNKVTKALKQKRERSALTTQNLRDFANKKDRDYNSEERDTVCIDSGAQDWLKKALNIDVKHLKSVARPQTAKSTTTSKNDTSSVSWSQSSNASSIRSRPQSGKESIRSSTSNISGTSYLSHISKHNELLITSKNKLLKWIKDHGLTPEQAYYEVIKSVYGPKFSPSAKLIASEFKKGLKRVNPNLEVKEIEILCKILKDEDQDVVNIEKWMKLISTEKPYQTYIKDLANKYNMNLNDVLRRMNLNDNSTLQDLYSLKANLKLLDPSLDDLRAEKISRALIQDKKNIGVDELIQTLSSSIEKPASENIWYQEQLIRIRKLIKDFKDFRNHFEKFDEKNRGIIDSLTFRDAILKYNLGFTPETAKQFVKNVERDSDMMVDYIRFVETIEKVKTENQLHAFSKNALLAEFEQFTIINDKLKEYFNTNKVQPSDLIRKLCIANNIEDYSGRGIPVDRFSKFLVQLCNSPFLGKDSYLKFSKKLDVDRDSFINTEDIETFFKRNYYIQENQKEIPKMNAYFIDQCRNELYPTVALTEEKIETILRDLRENLSHKKIGFSDLCRSMDTLKTGFININDFCTGLDKIMKLSQPIKDGFFAYIDTEKLGLISYDDLIKVLKRSVVDKRVEVTEDSFDWQNRIISDMKTYFAEKNLNSSDIFRILDSDFDGYINKNDLIHFITQVLNIPVEEITKTRIDRLFKLLDIYKRDRIQLNDIKIVFKDYNQNRELNPTANNVLKIFINDWKVHAKQQIGLILSKQFNDLKTSFNFITQDSRIMKYDQFKKWLESSQALNEFQLTDKLIQKLFADLDPHKKAYLNENDWFNAFKAYDVQNQLVSEVLDIICSQNSSIQNAYNFFLNEENATTSKNKKITYEGFCNGIKALLPNRLDNKSTKYIWEKFSRFRDTINLETFNKLFEGRVFTGVSYTQLPGNTQIKALAPHFKIKKFEGVASSKEEKFKKICERLKHILALSKTSVDEFFSQADLDNSGKLSNLEFINALKRLNLGLQLKELEELIVYCDSNLDGQIDFKEFISKVSPQFVEMRLFDRARSKLKHFKDNIYAYMLSPKDAFLNYNSNRTGKLTYEQFNNLVVKLSVLAREEVPSFHIIKDLFDFIDNKKDGVIDMNEWMQCFRVIENNFIGVNTADQYLRRRSATVNVKNLTKTHFNKKDMPKSALNPINKNSYNKDALEISNWECSKEYEKILRLIGRNRKLLITTFDEMCQSGIPVNPSKIKDVIGKLLETENIILAPEQWLCMYKFAEKDGIVDYKFMLEIFKERLYLLSAHPTADIVNL